MKKTVKKRRICWPFLLSSLLLMQCYFIFPGCVRGNIYADCTGSTPLECPFKVDCTELAPLECPFNIDCTGLTPIECAFKDLSFGRHYRKDFRDLNNPDKTDTWDDIRYKYHPFDVPDESYVYYNHLICTIGKFHELMEDTRYDEEAGLGLAESVNEVILGQTLIANQLLIDALRMRYPRAEDINAPRLPEPPSAREETGALELAVLEFRLGLRPAFCILKDYPEVFRSRGYKYSAFPQYITFVDPANWPPAEPGDDPPEQDIKNEFAHLTNALARKSLASVEIGKRLFRISTRDIYAKDDAITELKRGSQEAYLGSVILAACQNPQDFSMNGGKRLMIQIRNAQDLFKAIKSGLTPLGDDGKYIPNESVQSIYQDALDAVSYAREAEILVRNEDRTYDQLENALRTELQNQRACYLIPLNNKTGLDPEDYNNLHTPADKMNFVSEIRTRVGEMLEKYPTMKDASGLGELGLQILNLEDAKICVEEAYNELQNIPKRIEIENDRVGAVQKVIFDPDTQEKLDALEIARGYAQSHRHVRTISAGFSVRVGVSSLAIENDYILWEAIAHMGVETSVIYDPTALTISWLNNEERYIQMVQKAKFEVVNSEAIIRGIMLEVGNKALEVRRAQNRLNQEKVKLELMLEEINRLIDDLWNARSTAADLYFYDPSYRVAVSAAHERASATLDYSIDKLYRLAKTLEYYWAEPYRNPVDTSYNCCEPPALKNTLFDNFTEIEDLFGVRTADESKDYLDALKAWDSKLRRVCNVAVRGPNHSGPLTNKDISVREDILGFKTGDGMLTQEESIRLFRDYIAAHRVENPYNPDNPNLEFTFATTIADNRYFPAMQGRWNMRVDSIRADIYGNSGINPSWGVALVDLTQSGTITIRNYWGYPPDDDYLVTYTIELGERPDWSIFKSSFPSSINGQTSGIPDSEFWSTQLKGRSVAATNWKFKIDTNINENRNIDFSKIKDIILKFRYTFGAAEDFGI